MILIRYLILNQKESKNNNNDFNFAAMNKDECINEMRFSIVLSEKENHDPLINNQIFGSHQPFLTIFAEILDSNFDYFNPKPVQIELIQAKRSFSPQVKSLKWVFDREQFERSMKDSESNEAVLCDETGKIFEGLSSNFTALKLKDSKIILKTCPFDQILPGTILKSLINLIQSNDLNEIKIIYEHPYIHEIQEWKAAFLTSTSRFITPINQILVKTKNLHKLYLI